MSKTVLISAGEASGDFHGANLIKALQQLDDSIQVRAMGSSQLAAAGAEILVDCRDIAVVGLVEVLANYGNIKAALKRLQQELKDNPPDLLILIDYQEFNFRLARTAKALDIKVLFYISPQVWAWRPHRVHKIGKLIDMMAVLFPFEETFYKKAGVPVQFVGHPLVDEARPDKDRQTCMQEYGLGNDRKTIGLFPGSRLGEVKRVLPIQLASAREMYKKRQDLQFIIPIASTLEQTDISVFLHKYDDLPIRLVKDRSYNVMQVCDAIATASGTATLEIGLMQIPSVITYRVATLSYFILSRMITIDNIGLVNIVAEKNIVRELIQHEARPAVIARELERLLDDQDYRNTMIEEMGKVKEKLGKPGGSMNVAQLAYEMLLKD